MHFERLRRREIIALLGGVAAWPLAARAQEAHKLPTIGFLGPDPSAWRLWTPVFVQRLSELGWIEGRTIAIEYRWSQGRPERDVEIAAEFVARKVDVIVAYGAAIPALKQATSVIPIVFPIALDPIGAGFVGSLARPGGNVTGLSRQSTEAVAKRIEFLREIVPGVRRLAMMGTTVTSATNVEMNEVQTMAPMFGVEAVRFEIPRTGDFSTAVESLRGQADAVYVVTNGIIGANRADIAKAAIAARLPTMFSSRDLVEAGGLMSYGPNFLDMFRRAAELVDKILRGTKPSDIPIEQPTKFELIINLTTAKALGLTVPRILYVRAAEVID